MCSAASRRAGGPAEAVAPDERNRSLGVRAIEIRIASPPTDAAPAAARTARRPRRRTEPGHARDRHRAVELSQVVGQLVQPVRRDQPPQHECPTYDPVVTRGHRDEKCRQRALHGPAADVPHMLADHATSPPLTAAVTANHTVARACLRGRPASGAGRVAACCGADAKFKEVRLIHLLIGLSAHASVPDTSIPVPVTEAAVCTSPPQQCAGEEGVSVSNPTPAMSARRPSPLPRSWTLDDTAGQSCLATRIGRAAPPGHHDLGGAGLHQPKEGTMSYGAVGRGRVRAPAKHSPCGHSPRVQTRVRSRPPTLRSAIARPHLAGRDWTMTGGITVIHPVAACVTLALASPILSSPCEDDHDQNPAKAAPG